MAAAIVSGQKGGALEKLVESLNAGWPYRSLARFQAEAGLPLETIAEQIQVPLRTLHRRRLEGRLKPDESERLHRLANIFDKACALFGGNKESARRWLQSPKPALGNRAPLWYARTDVGAREVEDLIGQIEHGVFS
jgi:putative toxin-antitoxin system antitoxin component (TIGR02293 family)